MLIVVSKLLKLYSIYYTLCTIHYNKEMFMHVIQIEFK